MFKYEMHMHSSACSKCAVQNMNEIVTVLKNKGFSGAVITNHFYHGNTSVDRSLSWEKFVKKYEDDYTQGMKLAQQYNIKIFFGIEEKIVDDIGKEVLIYGVSPDIISKNPKLKDGRLKTISKVIHENGGLVIQAHPFRRRPYIKNPDSLIDINLIDGIECFNACNTNEDNEKSMEFAKKHQNMILISGSDAHEPDIIGKSYIETDELISSGTELVQVLINKNFKCVFESTSN